MTTWIVAYWLFGWCVGLLTGMTYMYQALRDEQEDNRVLSAQALPVGDQKMPIEGILGRAESDVGGGWAMQTPPSIYNWLLPDNIGESDWDTDTITVTLHVDGTIVVDG